MPCFVFARYARDTMPAEINVPLNVDGQKQSDHPTTPEEFQAKLAAAKVTLPEAKDAAIITHCGARAYVFCSCDCQSRLCTCLRSVYTQGL